MLLVQAATKAVAEAEKRKRDKKEAVLVAVAKARYDRRNVQESSKQAQLRSGTAICVWHLSQIYMELNMLNLCKWGPCAF